MSAAVEYQELQANEYYSLGQEGRLPQAERDRRAALRSRFQLQYEQWQKKEQYVWAAVGHSSTISFLDLDWAVIKTSLQRYFKDDSASFALLSSLLLSSVPAHVVESQMQNKMNMTEDSLFDRYRRYYAIRVKDYGPQGRTYELPLIETTVEPAADSLSFEDVSRTQFSKRIPREEERHTRLIVFPQTRYSFLEDEMLHGLYPIPANQAKIMAYKLAKWFQGNTGYYNTLATPFMEEFNQVAFDGTHYVYLAAMYPVIGFENKKQYENRKAAEKFISGLQKQSQDDLPCIAKARYARRFDLGRESQLKVQLEPNAIHPEAIQSGRGLFEYSCGDLDTMDLDLEQTIIREESSNNQFRDQLIQVEPLWLIVFPESNHVCVYRNEPLDGHRNHRKSWKGPQDSKWISWAVVLVGIINQADKVRSKIVPTYRVMLARLQIRIQKNGSEDYNLVKSLSNFVAELTALLDPLQAQIEVLEKWSKLGSKDDEAVFHDAINERKLTLGSLSKLQERARAAQELLIQLNNTQTAYQQSQLAQKMAHETKIQVDLAIKAERQNRSILVFTIVTVIFLPLSFLTSYLGMNTSDIRDMKTNQTIFWKVAGPVVFLAFCLVAVFGFRSSISRLLRRLGLPSPFSEQPPNHYINDIEGCKQE